MEALAVRYSGQTATATNAALAPKLGGSFQPVMTAGGGKTNISSLGVGSTSSMNANAPAIKVGGGSNVTQRPTNVKAFEAEDVGKVLEIRHNVGNRKHFENKLESLNYHAEKGELVKTKVVRNKKITRDHKSNLLENVDKRWSDQPDKVSRLKLLMDDLHVDHVHELQLGGLDHPSNLKLIDPSVNASFGKQIQLQLADVPVGTKITKVVEKVSDK